MGSRKLKLEKMFEVASERGGKCLSDFYVSARDHLLWQCGEGHEWKTSYDHIQSGSWCPICVRKPKITINDMKDLAFKKEGKCLSNIYINGKTNLQWECCNGHTWEARPTNVQQGQWCAQCSRIAPLSINDMKRMALERGGKCLSDSYKNVKTHLLWECDRGHQWHAIANTIQQGRWCPQCNESYGERFTRATLTTMFRVPFPKTRPSWLVTGCGKRLELDGFAKNLVHPVAFEYQGLQHYEQTWLYNADDLKSLQERDAFKRRICHEHGVYLIVVPQFKSFRNLSGCVDQIEAAILFAGLKIPRRWKRPKNMYEFLRGAPKQ